MGQMEGAAVGLGAGVYAPGEVARLAQIDTDRLRRWLHGYSYRAPRTNERKHSRPLVQREPDRTLSFLDLVEVCFVKAFLDHGVTMPTIRLVQQQTAVEFKTSHPFCTKRFETDGETIVARMVEAGKERLTDLKRRQELIREVFNPLLKQIDYDDVTDVARRWWPAGKDKPIVIDPARSFGAATVANTRVPTSVLFNAFKAGEKPEDIADWFDVRYDQVIAAIQFEMSLLNEAANAS